MHSCVFVVNALMLANALLGCCVGLRTPARKMLWGHVKAAERLVAAGTGDGLRLRVIDAADEKARLAAIARDAMAVEVAGRERPRLRTRRRLRCSSA